MKDDSSFAGQYVFKLIHVVSQGVAIAPADAVGMGPQALHTLPKLGIQFAAFAQKQLRHLVQHRLQAVVKGLVDVAKLMRELGAVLT